MSKEFNKFWERVKKENPNKVGKLGFMSFNELEEWSQRAFNAGAQTINKEFKFTRTCRTCSIKFDMSWPDEKGPFIKLNILEKYGHSIKKHTYWFCSIKCLNKFLQSL